MKPLWKQAGRTPVDFLPQQLCKVLLRKVVAFHRHTQEACQSIPLQDLKVVVDLVGQRVPKRDDQRKRGLVAAFLLQALHALCGLEPVPFMLFWSSVMVRTAFS